MKEKILSILFCSFLIFFFLLNLIVKDVEISTSERRKLNQFPNISIKNILEG